VREEEHWESQQICLDRRKYEETLATEKSNKQDLGSPEGRGESKDAIPR
jgi:hypothetical protein